MKEFAIETFLGKGSYGAVYKVKRRSDSKVYAIKEVQLRNMSPRERQESLNEIRLLASVSSPNICRYYDSFFENDKLFIVMDYAPKGDLQQAIYERKKRRRLFDEAQVWSMFLQVALALKHLHGRKILHRDLKTANIFMMGESIVKLGDLGVSKLLKADDQLAKTSIGTPFYISPEIWRARSYNEKSDVWSLGICLYEMLTFRHPYEAHDLKGLANKVLYGRRQPIASHYSTDMTNVLNACLSQEPSRRPSIETLFSMQEIRSRLHLVPTAHTMPGTEGQPPLLQPSPQLKRQLVDTIRFKRQGRQLAVNLPSPKYGMVSPKMKVSPMPDLPAHLPKIGARLTTIGEESRTGARRPVAPARIPRYQAARPRGYQAPHAMPQPAKPINHANAAPKVTRPRYPANPSRRPVARSVRPAVYGKARAPPAREMGWIR
ncbi:Protein kinase domain [Carpediemonas membranifera]|uniref:non-specific serine/threonine protein kinase n=1 Tax=Carpediemonas membranifera TaxID=201153 RepID=A0A8J6B5X0_9EUKA|nr:Protein kinase domain [Carpediemonas membranifera]|eukprot:KAG9394939.1 Protein kinase domain [Carpediemonas membranifera]